MSTSKPKPKPAPIRVCLYVRVSTKDKQNPENQLTPLRDYVASHATDHWEIVEEYVERESAAGKVTRPLFEKMIREAVDSAHPYDVILFWSLDRFSRLGVNHTVHTLNRLSEADVAWISYSQRDVIGDGTLGAFRDVIIAIYAAMAKTETDIRSQRALAAIDRRRRAGLPVGRQRKRMNMEELRSMRDRGLSILEMSRGLGVSRGTVQARIRELEEGVGVEVGEEGGE